MSVVDKALSLKRQGLIADALSALANSELQARDRIAADVFRVELVELVEPNTTIESDHIDGNIRRALVVFSDRGTNGHELSISRQSKLLPPLARVECEMLKSVLGRDGQPTEETKALGISRRASI